MNKNDLKMGTPVHNRNSLITLAAIMATLMYFYWASLMQKQQEISIQRSLSDTLELLKNIDSSSDHRQNPPHQNPPKDDGLNGHVTKGRGNDEFSVADRGFWQGLGATKGHIFDERLANEILRFFQDEKITSLLELGAGTGAYAKLIMNAGIHISCYDGNPDTQELSEGRCAIIDLSKPIAFVKHDWVLSLEVGEHIPKEFEDAFLKNLDEGNRHGMIVSWAVEGQGGTSHVNTHNNSYVREKLHAMGYTSDFEGEKSLRNAATMGWFKNTIMVFRRQE